VGPLKWTQDAWSAHIKKYRWPFMLAVILLFLYMLSQLNGEKRENPPPAQAVNDMKPSIDAVMEAYEQYYENMLRDILEAIVGVGDVSVMVNVDATPEQVFEKNTRKSTQLTRESDRQGGSRTVEDTSVDEEVLRMMQGSKEDPVVVKTLKPKIRGVVVVARGADNPTIKQWIYDVVSRSLDVPPHRISVVPKKIAGRD